MAGPAFRAAPVRVRVPATSANLGPAFDAAGLAVGLYDDVVVRIAESGLAVDVAGEGADDVRRDSRNLLVKTLRAAFDELGGQPRGLEVVCANRIPHGRGLGSSAGAIVAAIVAARALTLGGDERLDDAAALQLAARIEGHPDNVAACLLGGLTLAWTDRLAGPDERADGSADARGGVVHAVRLQVHPDLRVIAFVPAAKATTAKARKLLPEQVPHADAATNAGRSALLIEALTRRPDLLLPATVDTLHQPYRSSAMPRSFGLVERMRAAGVAAVISGAGPTVLALTTAGAVPQVVRDFGTGSRFVATPLPIDEAGARIEAPVS